MSKKWTLDLNKIKDVPGCRGSYKVGDSYCAMGKLLKALDLPLPYSLDGMHVIEAETLEFLKAWNATSKKYACDIAAINDCPGNFQKNHEKALDAALLSVINSGLVDVVGMEETPGCSSIKNNEVAVETATC